MDSWSASSVPAFELWFQWVSGVFVLQCCHCFKASAVPGTDATKVPRADCELAGGEGRDGSKRSTG